MKRITHFWIAAILIMTAASVASAQTSTAQPQSLGDYARTVRKDKKPSSAKQFDNENLPVDDKLSVVGGAATDPAVMSLTAAKQLHTSTSAALARLT